MPIRFRTPTYRVHKATGQAVVTLNGRDRYLGRYGTAASRAEYDRLISEWLTHGRRLPPSEDSREFTVNELILAFVKHAKTYYVKDGVPTSEYDCIRLAVRPVRKLYGWRGVTEFGPSALKTVRDVMITQDLSRKYVNAQTDRIKRMFRWGVEEELVPGSVYHALRAVSGLRRGRCEARETDPVRPVAEEHIEAVRPFVSPQVWAMIEVQRLTGMRPGEVVIMRGRDIDMTGKLWLYRPSSHKTEHHGHERAIELGPRAQAILRPFLKRDTEAYLISPSDAEDNRNAAKRASRRSLMTPSHRRRAQRSRLRPRRRKPQLHYSTDSYRRAISRACTAADLKAKKDLKREPDSERIIPNWHPHQLRHTFATWIRKEFGLEAAKALLGHQTIMITQHYAEMDRAVAAKVMNAVG